MCENLPNTDTVFLRGKFRALHSDFRREGWNQSLRYVTHKTGKVTNPKKTEDRERIRLL